MNSDFATNSVPSLEYWPNYQLDERMVRSKSRPVTALSLLQDKQYQPKGNNCPSPHHHQHYQHHVGEQRHFTSVTMSVPNPQRKIQINNIINDDLFYSTSPYDYTSTFSSETTPSLNDDHSLFEHNNFFDFSDDYGAQPIKSTSSPAIAAFSAAYDSDSSLFQKHSLNDMMNQLELNDMMINKMELRSHSRLKLDGLDTTSHQQQLHYPSSLNAHYLSESSALSLLTNSDRSPMKNSTGTGTLQDSFSLSEKSKIVGTIGRPYSTPVSTLNSSCSQGGSLNLVIQQPSKPNPLIFGGGSSSSHDLSGTFGGHLGPSSIALEKAEESPPLKTRQTSGQYDDHSGSRTLSWTELEFLDDDDDHDSNNRNDNRNDPTRPLNVYNSSNVIGPLVNNNDYSLLNGGFNNNATVTATNIISNGGMSNSDVPSSELGSYFQSFGGSASAPPLSYYKTDTSQQQQQGRNISIDSAVSSQSSHSDKLYNISVSSSSSSSLIQAGSMEEVVLRTCQEILSGASEHSLKAVELANTLRARVGIDVLSRIRERWGGLLSLLEKEHNLFRVDRIPKNDKVTLINLSKVFSLSHLSSLCNGNGNGNKSNSGGNNSNSSNSSGSGSSSRLPPSFSKSKEIHLKMSDPSFDPQTIGATRCLHVGNVPTNLSELQLMREFEKFGELDGLKLILQRNGARRFAFVTFRTVDQAVTARHCLSKVHPWKNAISFARREFGPSCPAFPQKRDGSLDKVGGGGGSSSHEGTAAEYTYYTDDHNTDHRMQPQQQQQTVFSYSSMPSLNSNNINNQFTAVHSFNLFNGSSGTTTIGQQLQQQQQQQQQQIGQHLQSQALNNSEQAGAVAIRGDVNCPILRRLCDDTYVPTQPWPINIQNDEPYCQAVIQQLMQFGGYTTISKLRGFLRNRVLANDNIKSVPLKAMLSAYPQYFVLESNLVSLKDF